MRRAIAWCCLFGGFLATVPLLYLAAFYGWAAGGPPQTPERRQTLLVWYAVCLASSLAPPIAGILVFRSLRRLRVAPSQQPASAAADARRLGGKDVGTTGRASPMLAIRDFSWDGYSWTAKVPLASWAGFQSRGGAYGSMDSPDPSNGVVTVVFAPEGRDDSPLTQREVDLVNWAVSHERAIRDSALAALLSRYDAMRADFLECTGSPDEMPPVESVDGFQRLIGLSSIHVHPVSKDGLPYIGLEFGCTWDAEHGLGMLMRGARVVDIGGADTAILLWMAERDAMRPDTA